MCVCMHAHGVFFDAGSGREFGFHICCVSVLIRFTGLEGLRLTVGALTIRIGFGVCYTLSIIRTPP